jgi:PAS domain-containing protein
LDPDDREQARVRVDPRHHVRGEPLRDRQGRIIQWYGLSVDIDDAKKAEDRLRRCEAYLAEAQRLSHTGNWVYDAQPHPPSL